MRSLGASDHFMLVALVSNLQTIVPLALTARRSSHGETLWSITTKTRQVANSGQVFYANQYALPVAVPMAILIQYQEKRPQLEATLGGNLIAWWVYRMSYVVALCFVKLSILFFYRAIASNRTFRRYVNATIVFVCLYTFAATIASAFQCQNPSDSWSTAGYLAQFDRNPNTKRPSVKCFDPVPLWVFSSASNLLTDIIIMLLPIPALLSLRVPMTKRLALIGIFSIGIMAIIASSVRMWVMFLWAQRLEHIIAHVKPLLTASIVLGTQPDTVPTCFSGAKSRLTAASSLPRCPSCVCYFSARRRKNPRCRLHGRCLLAHSKTSRWKNRSRSILGR
jgi:hypothetical protein